MHTPQASFYPLDASLVMSYRNHQKSLVYFSHLAPLTFFFFTKRPTQKRGGAPLNTLLLPIYLCKVTLLNGKLEENIIEINKKKRNMYRMTIMNIIPFDNGP